MLSSRNGVKMTGSTVHKGHDASTDADDDDLDTGIFQEPDGFRPSTPPPTTATYTLAPSKTSGREPCTITMELVGSHPLWGHHLWNAAPILSDYLQQKSDEARLAVQQRDKSHSSQRVTPLSCKGKRVLELGAAAGLPSIVAHHLGAQTVVSTDYPDPDLITCLAKNLKANEKESWKQHGTSAWASGYIWGSDTAQIKSHLGAESGFFDLVLMSDLIFNHQAHGAMLDTLEQCLPPPTPSPQVSLQSKEASQGCDDYNGPQALVFFTHHRPHLAHRDLEFFELARARGWTAQQIGNWRMEVSGIFEKKKRTARRWR